MLKKILAIKNVGRFRNCTAHGNVGLKRTTLVLGANGSGKTTICAILRSLQTQNPSWIMGRKTVDSDKPPTVELLVAGSAVKFNGQSWSASVPDLMIFDAAFIAQNVHSGEVVEVGHRRNLYRIIIGEAGVQLATTEADLTRKSRDKTNEITAVENRLRSNVPQGMSLAEFIGLPADQSIGSKIENEERTVRALERAQQVLQRPPLSEITLPRLPEGFDNLLSKTIDGIAEDAEARLAAHLAAHEMGPADGTWIAEGMKYTEDSSCPFCGQDIRGVALLDAYRTVFSREYKDLRDSIEDACRKIDEAFGDRAIGRLTTLAEQNRGAVEFWRQYCTLESASWDLPDGIPSAIRALRIAAITLLERKGRTPLEAVQFNDDGFNTAAAAYEEGKSKVRALASAITAANTAIVAKKKEVGSADLRAAKANLARLIAVKRRHSKTVADLCTTHGRLTGEKSTLEEQKKETRKRLNDYTGNVIAPYEDRINKYLDSFYAGFRIKNTRHSYQGGQPASSYQLVINGTAVNLGDGRTPNDVPSFKNTLSSGDRTTLALAFFLSSIAGDPTRSTKTIVFDDPFNSQDRFRRFRTIYAITRAAKDCAQVITLSHDPYFLKEIWDKVPVDERVTLNLLDKRAAGTMIEPVDIASACLGRTAEDVADLQAFLHESRGKPSDICRKMRVVLETYMWINYSSSFTAEHDRLGTMTDKIRDGGASHPAWALYDKLDEINTYSRGCHHGKNPAAPASTNVDPSELTGFVKDTLQIVHNLQA